MNIDKKTTLALWCVYGALLIVLLPHTAWAFSLFEPNTMLGGIVAWFGAGAFEFAIAVLTHKLALHISMAKGNKKMLVRFQRRYVNVYATGLLVAIGVSTLANLAHAVEFGKEMKIFANYGIPSWIYAAAFGAILPIVSLLFARVLANANDAEQEENKDLLKANEMIRELRAQLREQGKQLEAAEQRANILEASVQLIEQLRAENKAERILAASAEWPQLPQRSIALITETTPSYVSEVLRGNNGQDID